jgi:hypothetical protein
MPIGLKAFITYSTAFIAFDLVRIVKWPIMIPQSTTSITGPTGSMSYTFAMPFVFVFFVSAAFPKYKLTRPNLLRLPYIMLGFMSIEIIRGALDFFVNNESKWRLLISVVIPSIWIRVWFSKSVREYLIRGNERIDRAMGED